MASVDDRLAPTPLAPELGGAANPPRVISLTAPVAVLIRKDPLTAEPSAYLELAVPRTVKAVPVKLTSSVAPNEGPAAVKAAPAMKIALMLMRLPRILVMMIGVGNPGLL